MRGRLHSSPPTLSSTYTWPNYSWTSAGRCRRLRAAMERSRSTPASLCCIWRALFRSGAASASSKHSRAVRRQLRYGPTIRRPGDKRGAALQELGRPEEALQSYAKAVELRPDFAIARHHASFVYLQMGRFNPGWELHENREQARRDFGRPRWQLRRYLRPRREMSCFIRNRDWAIPSNLVATRGWRLT